MALALGMTVAELENRIEARELIEWMAYFSLEPWGQVQADYRAGMICSIIAKTMGGAKRVEPKDFFPLYSERNKKLQTPEEQIAIFKALAGK